MLELSNYLLEKEMTVENHSLLSHLHYLEREL
jgi:hypothetical protein